MLAAVAEAGMVAATGVVADVGTETAALEGVPQATNRSRTASQKGQRVGALLKAFAETMADPELIAEAQRIGTDIKLTTGEAVQQLVAGIYESPKPVIERLKTGLSGK